MCSSLIVEPDTNDSCCDYLRFTLIVLDIGIDVHNKKL